MTDMFLEAPRGHGALPATRSSRGDDYGLRLAARRREYRVYFALVLILGLPLAMADWGLRALRDGAWPAQGPLRAAWSHAAVVSGIILSA